MLHGAIIAVAALWPARYTPPPSPPGIITDITDPASIHSGVELPSDGDFRPVCHRRRSLIPPPPPTVEASTDTPPPEVPDTMDFHPAQARRRKTVATRTRAPRHPLGVPTEHGDPSRPGVAGRRAQCYQHGRSRSSRCHGPLEERRSHRIRIMARSSRITGSGSVRITTDGSGRVVSATVVQSTGNALLDTNTSSYARTAWSGPPNASTTVPITYQLR